MTSQELYKKPSVATFEIQNEGVVCDSDVIAVRVDYGEAIDEDW